MNVNIPRSRRFPLKPIERIPFQAHPWSQRASLWILTPIVPVLKPEQFAIAD